MRRCSTCARAPLILLRTFPSDTSLRRITPPFADPRMRFAGGETAVAVVGGFSDFFGNPFKYVYAAACATDPRHTTDPPPIHYNPPRRPARPPRPSHPALLGLPPPPPPAPFTPLSAGAECRLRRR